MTLPARDGLILVPGFMGFGTFGSEGRRLIQYYQSVKDEIARHYDLGDRVVYHEPPPTASLAARVKSLYAQVTTVLARGVAGQPVDRVHLVGHSAGGVDARLLTNARYLWPGGPGGADRTAFLPRIASVITVSAPFHGTPLARRLQGMRELAIPAFYLASILATKNRLWLAGQLGRLNTVFRELLLQKASPSEAVLADLADVDEATARQIKRFLDDIIEDHTLVDDLTPGHMALLNRDIAGGDFPRIHSFVTAAPPPGLGLRDALDLVRTPVRRTLYKTLYALTSWDDGAGPRVVPRGEWLGHRPRRVTVDAPGANDGIVPAWSQTLTGHAAGLVAGDHLDVIGHYDSVGLTIFKSGSGFDDARFRALWRAVARVMSAA